MFGVQKWGSRMQKCLKVEAKLSSFEHLFFSKNAPGKAKMSFYFLK
jgi:hypothetical protein